jgi:exodeoxyribonuclease VII large subunit
MESRVGRQRIAGFVLQADGLAAGMRQNLIGRMERAADRLEGRYARLTALSPFDVLSRGYAILETANGKTVSAAAALSPEDDVNARFHDGRVAMKVKEVYQNDSSERDS